MSTTAHHGNKPLIADRRLVHARVVVPTNRPRLREFYDETLGADQHQVLEALWEARLARPLFNRVEERLILEKAQARGVSPATAGAFLARLRAMGALSEANMVRARMGIELDPIPAHLFPQTVADLERLLRRSKATRQALVGMRESTYIAALSRHAKDLRTLLASEVHPLVDAMEREQVARITGPAYLRGILEALARPAPAPTLLAAFARRGWKTPERAPGALIDPEEVVAVGAPAAIRQLARARQEDPLARVEALWQTDTGHLVLVRSAAGTSVVSLERLALLVQALPPGRPVELRCGADHPALICSGQMGDADEEHAVLAPCILGKAGVEGEPGALELHAPELLEALNRRFLMPETSGALRPREVAESA